ncbi:MAG: NAD(P)-dependent oxidoreductase [Chloroflexi bacterium]|nr:NAD(P)-dependent oxidoreductase [Chloroflexota bacterium]
MMALVTGLGYLGVPLAEALLARGEAVVGLENGFSTVPSAVARLARHPRFRLIRGSVNSPRSIERAFTMASGLWGSAEGRTSQPDVDTVYHLAAQASAHPEAAPPSYTEATNLVAPRLIFEAAAHHGARAFVYGSSFRVYGDDLSGVVDESTPYGRIGDLSHVSKVYAEKLFEMLAAQHALPAVSVRLGVVYGRGPLMKHDPRFLTVPNLFCLRTARGKPLTVHAGANRPIGFLHLTDAVDALLAAADFARGSGTCPEATRTGGPDRFAVMARAVNAVGEVLGVGEVAAIVEREANARGLRTQIEGAGPLTAPRWSVSSGLDATGYQPRRTMSETLGAVLDFFLETEPVGRPVVRTPASG